MTFKMYSRNGGILTGNHNPITILKGLDGSKGIEGVICNSQSLV